VFRGLPSPHTTDWVVERREIHFLTLWNLQVPDRGVGGVVPFTAHFSICRRPSSLCLLVIFPLYLSVSKFPLLTGTLIILD
jgi:hypothetical protein